MAFEKFIPRRMVIREARINITPSGIFWFNPNTTRKFFQGFKRIFLLYDKERRVIGFQPTHEEKDSYVISRHKRRNTSAVSGMAFLKYYQIPHKEIKSYRPTWNNEEKLVEVNLNEPL